jgi:glycine/serine hydroxymethyltransferase
VPFADFVTSTTHKSLRGPRGGVIMCKEEFAKKIDAQVFPGIQGGPLMHVIAAKAICFGEALKPEFKAYQAQIVKNAQTMASRLTEHGFRIVSGGTDNHVMLVDLRSKNLNGTLASHALDEAGITVNKNSIPFDTGTPMKPSGIRIGTPAVTTRGMKEADIVKVADFINEALQTPADWAQAQAELAQDLQTCDAVYLTICLDVLSAAVAPGVSAPAALGVPMHFVETVIEQVKASGKLIAADMAELNPNLDRDGQTARVGARLLARVAGLGQ